PGEMTAAATLSVEGFLVFFFSSRRRHTRFSRDWSSDVCSSDLKMKKDIEVPKSENVFLAAIAEWNDDFQEESWYVHLVNNTDKDLEMVLVVSRAYGIINNEQRKTGTFRHGFKEVPAKSTVKIELLENNV